MNACLRTQLSRWVHFYLHYKFFWIATFAHLLSRTFSFAGFLLFECQNVKLPYNLNIYIFRIYPAVFTLAIHTIVRFECAVYNATSRAKLIKWLPRGLCVSVPMLFWRILIRPSMKLLPLNHKSLPHLQLAAHGYRWQLRTALEVLQQFNLLTEN